MSNLQNDIDSQFSAYEKYLETAEQPKLPQGDGLLDDADFDYQLPILKEEEEPTTVTVPQETKPEEPAVSEEPKENSVPVNLTESPKHQHPPLTLSDMEKMAAQVEESLTSIIPLRNQAQQMLKAESDTRLPKGLRTIARNLNELTDLFIATKAIVKLYMEMGVEPLYQSIDDSKLKSSTSNTSRALLSHLETMQEGLNDIEGMMGDRPAANLRARIVKAQTVMLQTHGKIQAQAVAQTIDMFPLKYGALRLLCMIEEKGDKEVMQAMDSTLRQADVVQIPVADAPAMLQAVQNNDQKAVDAIVNRMIQNS